MQREPLPKISLFCTKGGADKEYHAEIKEVADGYIVQTRFGKRGAAKIPKSEPPVLTYEEAVAEFESIVKDKKSPKKGYTEDVSGTAYDDVEFAGKMSGNLPHLLVRLDESNLESFIQDDRYSFEEKIDGERLMLQRNGESVTTSNKLGVINAVSMNLIEDACKISSNAFKLDGENLNRKYYVFDILELDGVCLKKMERIERYKIFQSLEMPSSFVKVPMVVGQVAKRAFFEEMKLKKREGIVAKLLDAPYVEGRAAPKLATQFKFKFMDEVSCIVLCQHKTKRSVELGLLGDDGSIVAVGNVTIPSNATMPRENDIIDVAFMYMYKDGALFQPQYLKPRTDVDRLDCLLSQISRIKPKSSEQEEE
jgi:bifunctional non-homologous end joining protein LigD